MVECAKFSYHENTRWRRRKMSISLWQMSNDYKTAFSLHVSAYMSSTALATTTTVFSTMLSTPTFDYRLYFCVYFIRRRTHRWSCASSFICMGGSRFAPGNRPTNSQILATPQIFETAFDDEGTSRDRDDKYTRWGQVPPKF